MALSHRIGAARPLQSLLRSPLATALVAPRSVDDYLQLFNPAWSVHEARARVSEVRRERGGAVSLLLEPNRAWNGFRAGQHTELRIERAGIRHTRCFSLSSAPSDPGPVRVSMRALPGGKVSGWALEAAREGDVVMLSQAQGSFVLPEVLPDKLLFVSAGSGVTPILSMVRELAHTRHGAQVTWLHWGRSQTMLEDELFELDAEQPWLHLTLVRTEGPSAAAKQLRRLSLSVLNELVPAWAEHETFACGPGALLGTAGAIFSEQGLADRLHIESFGTAWPSVPLDARPVDARIVFERSGRQARATQGLSLLEQAEAAGLTPRYGCRMGICHTCKCTKISGAVRDARTGVVSDRPNEEIRLCISTPRSDVTLDL